MASIDKIEKKDDFNSVIQAIGDKIDMATLIIAAVLLAFMSIILLVGIFMRYVFQSPPIWIEEGVRYLMIWAVCLSMSSGVKRCEHISIHFFFNILPGLLQRLVGYVLHLVLVCLLGILIFYGIELVQSNLGFKSQALELNMGFVVSVVPISAALMLIQLVINFIVAKNNDTFTGRF